MALRERLAVLTHDQWSGWMKYLFSKSILLLNGAVVIPPGAVNRWKEQMETPYAELSEEERESDLTEANKFLKLFEQHNTEEKTMETSNDPKQALPRYKSHKIVQGGQIQYVGEDHLHLTNGITLIVGKGYINKHKPFSGGYYVRYKDGYESFSPAVEFEDGELTPQKTFCSSDIWGAMKNVPDIQKFGNGDMFQFLCKASSKKENWMKSTKAMEIPGIGCVVQVTIQQGNNVAVAVTFVPGVKIDGDGENGRKLARDSHIS